MNLLGREPVDVRNVEFQLRIGCDLFLDLVEENISFVSFFTFGKSADYTPSLVTYHREKCGESVLAQVHVQRIMLKRPIDIDVGNVESSLERTAAKIYAERVTDEAMRTVTAEEIL